MLWSSGGGGGGGLLGEDGEWVADCGDDDDDPLSLPIPKS